MSRSLWDCSAVRLDAEGTLTGFPLVWTLVQKRESVAETSSSCLQVNFFTRRPCLQPTVKIPWTWAKDDIHTLPSQHKPPCTAKLQNRCQAIRLHSGGPFQKTWLSVDMVYLSWLVLCFQMLLLSLAALVSPFFKKNIDNPRASYWLIQFSFSSPPFLFIFSQAAKLRLSLRLSFITLHEENPPGSFFDFELLTFGYFSLHSERRFPFKKREPALCVLNWSSLFNQIQNKSLQLCRWLCETAQWCF